MRTIRIGCGAGYSDDLLEPALDLLEQGNLDYIAFECLAERTIAIAQSQRLANPDLGYNSKLEYRMEHVLPLIHKHKVKLISNMGVANVQKAVEVTARIAKKHGLDGLKIAGVLGDDVFPALDRYRDAAIMETGLPLSGFDKEIVSANAYLGCEGIVEALRDGADVVITGRCSDPALFLAPLVHEFGWNTDDLLGKGTCVGHLMECAGYLTGGYFASTGLSEVPEMWNNGYPIAEVREDGEFHLSKLDGTGGRLDRHTAIEQLLYELHDPANYITPNVVADFSKVMIEDVGPSRVKVTGATGKPRTGTLKVSIGYRDSIMGITEVSLGGIDCIYRCELLIESTKKLWEKNGIRPLEHKCDIIGYNSVCTGPEIPMPPKELINDARVRVAVRTNTKAEAQRFMDYCTAGLGCLPAGGAIMTNQVKEVLAIMAILIPREDLNPSVFHVTV